MKFLYWGFLLNSVKKFKFWLKLDKNKRKALYLNTHVDFLLLRLLILPLFLLLLWLVMIPLIFWLARLPVFHSLLCLHERFRSVPLCRHFLSCCCCGGGGGGGGSENGEDLALPPQKKPDLLCWQATDLYQYIIHIGNQLFILHTTNEKLFSSFQFIVDKNNTIYWEFTIHTFLLAQGAL